MADADKRTGGHPVLKWILAPAALFIVALLIAGSILVRQASTGYRAEIEKLRAAGEPVTVADLPEAPAGEDVFQVETALALLPTLSKEETLFLGDFATATDPAAEDITRARELVVSLQPALDALHKGFAQPVIALDGHCADPASLQRLSMLSSARQAARAQAAAARLACIDGRGDEAMLMACDALRLSEALAGTRSFLCMLTADAIFAKARITAQHAVAGASVSPALLRETSARFAGAGGLFRARMADALMTERAVAVTFTEGFLGHEPSLSWLQSQTPGGRSAPFFLAPLFKNDCGLYLRTMSAWIGELRDTSRQLPSTWTAPPMPRLAPFASMGLQSYTPVPGQLLRLTAASRATAVGLAVAADIAEGKPAPADLSAFDPALAIDPSQGRPFVVVIRDSSWMLCGADTDVQAQSGETHEGQEAVTGDFEAHGALFVVPLKR